MAAARASGSSREGIVIGLVVLLVLAAVVVGGAVWVTAGKAAESAAPIPPVTSAPDTLSVSVPPDTATVLVGSDTAPVTVDVYEDFLCPACRQFEQRYAEDIHAALTSGSIRVRYHPLNLLDRLSDPPGYSLLAANAALSVAEVAPDRFLDFHHSLFAAQPDEGGRGYSADQLVELANRLGVSGPRLVEMIKEGAFDEEIRRSLSAATSDPDLQRPRSGGGTSFGTPTVAVDGKLVDHTDPNWLDEIIEKAGDH